MSRLPHLVLLLLLAACGTPDTPTSDGNGSNDTLVDVLKAIEERILSAPDDASAFAERARYYQGIDSLDLAVNDWKRAMVLAPTDPQWPIALADLYYQKLRLEEAEELLISAAALDTSRHEALLKRSEIKLLKREYKEAMTLANAALKKEVRDPKAYYLKGWIHMEAGDTALSISSYRTAVEQDPSFYEGYIALGLLHAAQRDPLALQYYNTAIDIRPTSVEAWYNKAMYCQENQQDSLALLCYERIKAIDPRNAMAYYNTGFVYLQNQQRVAEARTQFLASIVRAPRHAPSHYNLGLTYELENKLDSALVAYKGALKLDPSFDLPAEGLSRLQAKGVQVSYP
jgi:tetratricopeptide (TPR) repeat protein